MFKLNQIKSFARHLLNPKYYKKEKEKVDSIKASGIVKANGRFIYEPTVRCNLNCKMCYIPKELKHSSPNELSLEQIKDFFKPMIPEMNTVNIIGGEPFCRQDILEIIKFFTDNGVKINSLATNATLLNDAKTQELIKNEKIESVGVSIDSADPETHDSIRGIKGSFRRSTTAIKALVEAGKNVETVTVVLKENLDRLKELVDLGKELGVSKVIFEYERYYTADELDETKKKFGLNSKELDVPPSDQTGRDYKFSELKKAIKDLRKHAKKTGVTIDFFPGYFLGRMKDCYNREIRKNNKVYCDAFFRPRIDWEGNLMFCYLLKKLMADLTKEELSDVWNSEKIKDLRKKLLKNNMSPACEGCFYLRIL